MYLVVWIGKLRGIYKKSLWREDLKIFSEKEVVEIFSEKKYLNLSKKEDIQVFSQKEDLQMFSEKKKSRSSLRKETSRSSPSKKISKISSQKENLKIFSENKDLFSEKKKPSFEKISLISKFSLISDSPPPTASWAYQSPPMAPQLPPSAAYRCHQPPLRDQTCLQTMPPPPHRHRPRRCITSSSHIIQCIPWKCLPPPVRCCNSKENVNVKGSENVNEIVKGIIWAICRHHRQLCHPTARRVPLEPMIC